MVKNKKQKKDIPMITYRRYIRINAVSHMLEGPFGFPLKYYNFKELPDVKHKKRMKKKDKI